MYQTLYYAAKYCSPEYCSLKYCLPNIVSGLPWLESTEVLRRKKHNTALLYHGSMSTNLWTQIYCAAKYYIPKYCSMLSNGRTWVQYTNYWRGPLWEYNTASSACLQPTDGLYYSDGSLSFGAKVMFSSPLYKDHLKWVLINLLAKNLQAFLLSFLNPFLLFKSLLSIT